jgi:cytochrome c oxidase subunit IV
MTDAHHQGEHTSGHKVKYLAVFFGLCGFTALSVLCDKIHFPVRRIHGINPMLASAVLAVAACKALLVMRNFMHLKFEGKWKFLLLVPTAILALGLPLALLPDVGVHYYTTDVPQTSAKVSEEAPGVNPKEAAEHPREVTP